MPDVPRHLVRSLPVSFKNKLGHLQLLAMSNDVMQEGDLRRNPERSFGAQGSKS